MIFQNGFRICAINVMEGGISALHFYGDKVDSDPYFLLSKFNDIPNKRQWKVFFNIYIQTLSLTFRPSN